MKQETPEDIYNRCVKAIYDQYGTSFSDYAKKQLQSPFLITEMYHQERLKQSLPSEKEALQRVLDFHRQNLNTREDFEEAFEKGAVAMYEEFIELLTKGE